MSFVNQRTLFVIDDSGADTEQLLAHVEPAKDEDVRCVLACDEYDFNGRSNWVWVRLQNGELILGCYPQGDTYTKFENRCTGEL